VSQRDSGYERKERDLYETPEWVTLALAPHIPEYVGWILEPAAGGGKMVRALQSLGHTVEATDIDSGFDFMDRGRIKHDAIITNPPYVLAEEFITHALDLMQNNAGFVAMLLRTDYDHARTRSHLFAEHRAFSKKVVLTKRIQWFEDSKGSPSFNHAWFIWDWTHEGAPTLAYAPRCSVPSPHGN
jgi:hypothetical protein